MNTYIEHFATLKQPYRDQAILNYVNRRLKVNGSDFSQTTFSLSSAIMNGFSWSHSPEGESYWQQVFENPAKHVSKPLPEPEKLDGYSVEFQADGSIKVGCQHIQLDQLETILSKAREAKEG